MRTHSTLFVLAFLLVGCGGALELDDDAATDEVESPLATVNPESPIAQNLNGVGELSGLVASQQYPHFFWAHRDGLNTDRASRLRAYALKIVDRQLQPFTGASGSSPTREFTFAPSISIENINWEDITLGPDARTGTGWSLYIGDVGNNPPKGSDYGTRNSYQVYQFQEPNPEGASTVIPALQATWRFRYPTTANGKYPNCEVLFFLDGNLYIITKEPEPRVFRLPDGFTRAPATVHTLVPVTNGAVTSVVGAVSKPSYASYSWDRKRFMVGGHEQFHVYSLPANTLTGDAFVKAMLLTAGKPQDTTTRISSSPPAALNTEGGTYEAGTKNVVLGTESKLLFHWPRANIEAP